MAVRLVPRGLVGRAMTSAALAIILLASGLQAAAPSSPRVDGSTAATPIPTAAPAISAIGTGPIASGTTPLPADPEYADQIVALGLDEATAAFMARTLSTVEAVDAHTFVVHHAFPNGATGDETYHLVQGFQMSPGDPPTIVSEVVGDELRYQLRYAVDPAELPGDLRAQVLEGLPVLAEGAANTTTPAVRLLGLAPVAPMRAVFAAEAPGTLEVVVDGVISQGQETYIDSWADRADSKGWTKTAKSWEAFKAGKKVWEAVEANELITSALDRLKALRECAEKPTNPLTQQQYGENPSEQQKVLDDLTEAENDIRASAMVMFTSMLTDTGSSLIKAAPWLGFIVGPANNYIKETNVGLINERVRAAEQRVVPCQRSVLMVGGANYLKINAVVCDITKPFTVTGGKITVHFTPSGGDPSGGGTYRYSGDFGKFSVAGQGTYKVNLTADGGSIVAKGPGTATTPKGTFGASGKETYRLTPTSCD
jgi:hypothetical protein